MSNQQTKVLTSKQTKDFIHFFIKFTGFREKAYQQSQRNQEKCKGASYFTKQKLETICTEK